MALSLTRANKLYGRNGRLAVGKTKFHQDFIDNGSDPFVPGTSVPRLKPVNIGPRAIAFFDDEVDALVEGLRAARDTKARLTPKPGRRAAQRAEQR